MTLHESPAFDDSERLGEGDFLQIVIICECSLADFLQPFRKMECLQLAVSESIGLDFLQGRRERYASDGFAVVEVTVKGVELDGGDGVCLAIVDYGLRDDKVDHDFAFIPVVFVYPMGDSHSGLVLREYLIGIMIILKGVVNGCPDRHLGDKKQE